MALRRGNDVIQRLTAESADRLNVTYQSRPCVLFFSGAGRQLTLVDAESARSLASLQRMPGMEPLRIVGDAVRWDERSLTVRAPSDIETDARRFVETVNRRTPGGSVSEQLSPAAGVGSPYDGPRWQFAVINIGMFNAMARFQRALGAAAQHGWEVVGVYDKASNWLAGLEKGFVLLKRPVVEGAVLHDDEWCVLLDLTGT